MYLSLDNHLELTPPAAAEKAGRAWWTGGGAGADLPAVARRGARERCTGQGREGFGGVRSSSTG